MTFADYGLQAIRKFQYALCAISFVSLLFGAIAIGIASHSLSVSKQATDNRFPTPAALLQTQTEEAKETFLTVKKSLEMMMSLNESIEKIMKLNTTLQLLLNESNSADLGNITGILLRGYIELDDGWVAPFNGHQYKATPDLQSWSDSRTTCQSWGGDLIAYGFEDVALRVMIKRALSLQDVWYWVGLTDQGTQGRWRWVNGLPANNNDATLWRTGEPSDFSGIEDCGATDFGNSNRSGFLVNDVQCSHVIRSVCEKLI